MNLITLSKKFAGPVRAALLCLALASCASAADKAVYGGSGAAEDRLPPMKALKKGVLPNGLTYYILENSLPAERADLTLAVKAGSILETDEERGFAHFTEHMAFNGTRRFPETELINFLRSLGMRFGPEVNAYTGYDQTVYTIETPTEKGEDGAKHIPARALEIIDDWTWAISFNPRDVDDERSVIMEEYRSRLGAQERVFRRMLPVIFRDSRYAERLPIGLPEIIQNAPAALIEGFYKKWYRPDNMAVILVGDFDGEALERELSAHFTAPRPEVPAERPYYELPEPRAGSLVSEVITDSELAYSIVYLYHKRSPRAAEATLEQYRRNLVDFLIESMIDYRNEEAIYRGDSPFIGAAAWNSRYGKTSRYHIYAAESKANRTAETLRALLLQKESMTRYGFTQSELDRAKASLASGLERRAAEKDRQPSDSFSELFTADFLGEDFALDVEWERDAAARLLPGITVETVNGAVRAYFADDDLAVLIAAPAAEALPGRDAIARMVREAKAAEIARPLEAAKVEPLVSGAPRAGRVVSERKDGAAEIWELSNGARVIVRETANRNNELALYAVARGGVYSAGDASAVSAELAAEVQAVSALGGRSRQELMQLLSDKQLSLRMWTNSYARGFQGVSSGGDLETFFQLLYLTFTGSGADDTGIDLVRDQRRSELLYQTENPESYFLRELKRITSGNHPRFLPLEAEDLEKLDKERAAAFLKHSLDPADFTFVFAGTIGERERFRALAETWLASIPSTAENFSEWKDPHIAFPRGTETFLRKGQEAKSIVYQGWLRNDFWSEAGNAVALTLNEYLDIVLNDAIREEKGGVYSIQTRVAFTPMPTGELTLEIYFICDPAREAELRGAVRDKLASLAEGLDEATFIRSREALIKAFEQNMEENGFIARNLAVFSAIMDIPLSHLEERPQLYREVIIEEVQGMIERLLETESLEVVLLPAAGGPEREQP
ncbi:MAG: insulinase family protein [Treponema sp.]|jgi:zinc protease|nr:insulinase family protein [Treponema sp.]